MSWLFDWAGMKKRRPRRDGLLLAGTALVIVFSLILGVRGVSALIEQFGESWRLPLLVTGVCAYALIVLFLYFAQRRLETGNLMKAIGKGRSNPPGRGLSS